MARRRKRPSTKAVLHAARQLGIDDDELLARVMRCSLETVRRYREGQELARVSFHLQTSWLLIDTARLVRTKAAPGEKSVSWMRTYDYGLGMAPAELLTEEWGLDRLHTWLAGPQPEPKARPRRQATPRPVIPPVPEPRLPPRPKITVEPDETWWGWVAGGVAAVGATALGAVLWVARSKR